VNNNISGISVIDPIGEAIDRVKEVLFNPFDMGKWFTIGFCAWLATLLEGGGGGGSGGGGGGGGGSGGGSGPAESIAHLKDVIIEHLPLIITIAIPVLIIVIAIGIVCLWLSSRGKFMFLHCVAENKAEVKLPWHKFHNQGNSLFLFRLIVGIIAFVSIALFLGMMAVPIVLLARGSSYAAPALIAGIVLLALIAISLGIVFGIILKFTEDFVVPIMYLRGYQCVDAWNEFRSLLTGNKGKFTLYILFQIVIAIAIGIIILALVCVTCCCAGCIMAIPYIGTVLLLPVFVFSRSYSLYYLAQYGRGYDVFVPTETAGEQVSLPPEPEQ
jgi:hypothetical protein